jgi:hypothetical protein
VSLLWRYLTRQRLTGFEEDQISVWMLVAVVAVLSSGATCLTLLAFGAF